MAYKIQYLSVIFFCSQWALISCGDAPTAPQKKTLSEEPKIEDSGDVQISEPKEEEKKNSRLVWNLNCTTSHSDIVGHGTHYVKKDGNIDLYIEGEACHDEQRKVVFAIDSSRFTDASDPIREDGTCLRYEGVKKIVNNMPDGSLFSLIAFDSVVRFETNGFLSKDDFTNATGSEKICRSYSFMRMKYRAGLSAVQKLFKDDTGERKNIYLFTASSPYTNNDGTSMAESLKEDPKVRLSTINLGDKKVGQYLEANISSQILENEFLHHNLGDAGFSNEKYLTPSKLYSIDVRYKAVSQNDFEITEYESSKKYIVSIKRLDAFEGGLDFVVSYWNNMGEFSLFENRIVWEN